MSDRTEAEIRNAAPPSRTIDMTNTKQTVLTDILACCRSWDSDVRILGNVRAGDAAAAIESALSMLRAAPQADADARNAALEEAALLMEATGKRIAASDIRAKKSVPTAQDPAKGADVALPPLPDLQFKMFYRSDVLAELEAYARAAVLADRQQRKPWPMEEQPDGTVTPVDPIDRQQRGGDDFSGVQPPMRHIAGVNVDVLRRAALSAQPAASAEPACCRCTPCIVPGKGPCDKPYQEDSAKGAGDVVAWTWEDEVPDPPYAGGKIRRFATHWSTGPRDRQRPLVYGDTTFQQRGGDAVDPNNYKGMFEAAVRALAQIDRMLGLPEDGCNSPQATVAALSEFISGFDHLKKEWEAANKARAALAATKGESNG